jgi:hypothetical protein
MLGQHVNEALGERLWPISRRPRADAYLLVEKKVVVDKALYILNAEAAKPPPSSGAQGGNGEHLGAPRQRDRSRECAAAL